MRVFLTLWVSWGGERELKRKERKEAKRSLFNLTQITRDVFFLLFFLFTALTIFFRSWPSLCSPSQNDKRETRPHHVRLFSVHPRSQSVRRVSWCQEKRIVLSIPHSLVLSFVF